MTEYLPRVEGVELVKALNPRRCALRQIFSHSVAAQADG